MATEIKRQTAGNNATLARVKKLMNAKVYAGTRAAWEQGGENAARDYLGQFFNDEYRPKVFAELFAS